MNIEHRPQLRSDGLREAYLSDVSREVQGSLTPLEAFESVQEMREHLNAMAAAYVDLGTEPCAAMLAAIDKFGPARRLGKVLIRSARPQSRAERASVLAVTASFQGVLGAWYVILVDAWLRLNGKVVLGFGVDIIVGGLLGIAICLIGSVVRVNPMRLAVIVGMTVGLMLFWILSPRYWEFGQYTRLSEVLCFYGLGAACLTLSADWIERTLRHKRWRKWARRSVADDS